MFRGQSLIQRYGLGALLLAGDWPILMEALVEIGFESAITSLKASTFGNYSSPSESDHYLSNSHHHLQDPVSQTVTTPESGVLSRSSLPNGGSVSRPMVIGKSKAAASSQTQPNLMEYTLALIVVALAAR